MNSISKSCTFAFVPFDFGEFYYSRIESRDTPPKRHQIRLLQITPLEPLLILSDCEIIKSNDIMRIKVHKLIEPDNVILCLPHVFLIWPSKEWFLGIETDRKMFHLYWRDKTAGLSFTTYKCAKYSQPSHLSEFSSRMVRNCESVAEEQSWSTFYSRVSISSERKWFFVKFLDLPVKFLISGDKKE